MTTLAHDGTETRFTVHGDGPAIVLSPLRTTGKVSEGYIQRLADRYRVVLMDYPGTPKPRTLTPDRAVTDVLAVADAAGLDRFAWWGYSFGSVLGLQLSTRTDRIAAFVCGGWTPLGGPYAEMLQMSRRLAKLTSLSRKLRGGAQQWTTFYECLQAWDEHEALAALDETPRLVVVGSEDNPSSPLGKAPLASTVQARQDELETLGWAVCHLDGHKHGVLSQPEVVVPAVRAWLDGQPAWA